MNNPIRLALSTAAAILGCSQNPGRQFVPLASSVQLAPGRPAILLASEPLRTPSPDNQVCMQVSAPFALDSEGFGILTAEGKRIELRMMAMNQSGDSSLLSEPVYQGHQFCLALDPTKPSASPFAGIHIVSSTSVRLDSVQWQSTDK
jgi:hypothetical protein